MESLSPHFVVIPEGNLRLLLLLSALRSTLNPER